MEAKKLFCNYFYYFHYTGELDWDLETLSNLFKLRQLLSGTWMQIQVI